MRPVYAPESDPAPRPAPNSAPEPQPVPEGELDWHRIGCLLEDGDAAGLAWLCRRLPEADLASWVERHGARRLSRRSLAFWELILGLPRRTAQPAQPAALALRRELWPL